MFRATGGELLQRAPYADARHPAILSLGEDRALVRVGLEALRHPDALVQRQRARVIRRDAELSLTQAGRGEQAEGGQQHGAAEPASLVVRVDGEQVDIADRLLDPAVREQETDDAPVLLGDEAELGREVVRLEVLLAKCGQRLGPVVGIGGEARGVELVQGDRVALDFELRGGETASRARPW